MKKLLFLDDSTMSQQLVTRFLEGVCSVTVVGTLEAGTRLLAGEAFDIILADYLFPEGDLLDFLTEVRADHDSLSLPIIVASGSLDRQMMSQVLLMGANDCMAKPFRRAELREMVTKMIDAPYVKIPEREVAVALAFEWNRGEKYYQFMPEIGKTVEAASPGEAAESMHALLQAESLKGAKLGYIFHGRVVTHVVERQPAHKEADGGA